MTDEDKVIIRGIHAEIHNAWNKYLRLAREMADAHRDFETLREDLKNYKEACK